MKKMIICLSVLLAMTVSVFAGPPTDAAIDAAYNVDYDTIWTGANFDTLFDDGDSSTLFTKSGLNTVYKAWHYIFVRDAITGETSDDSVDLQLKLDVLDENDSLLYRTIIDTMTTIAGEAIDLPIGGSVIGPRYRLKAFALTGVGDTLVLNRMYLMKRRSQVKFTPVNQ